MKDPVDGVPAPPGVDAVEKLLAYVRVVGAKIVDVVRGVLEDGRLLLTLDGVAVLLWRLQVLPLLCVRWNIYVTVGQVTEADRVPVRWAGFELLRQ